MNAGGGVLPIAAKRSFRNVWCGLAVLTWGLTGSAGDSRAAETQWWITNTAAAYAEAEARGVLIDREGVVRLGPAVQRDRHDSLSTMWAVTPLGDQSLAVAGDGGRVDRWSRHRGFEPWVRLPVGQVLALARDGEGVVAGTGPEGWIYRIAANGDTTRLAETGERYVWGLVSGAAGVWYAATGTQGKILKIERGRVEVALDTEAGNIVALISDGQGGVYAGDDASGRVLHVRRDGSARTLFEAPENEVRALAIGPDGALYAAAMSARAVSPPPPITERNAGGNGGNGVTVSAAAPSPARSAVSGGKATVYRILPDSAVTTYWSSPQPFIYALAPVAGGIVAATGNRAGLYLLERPMGAVQWLAAPEGQLTALAVDDQGRVYATSANPGALWQAGPAHAARGELISDVLDAGRIAQFGRLRWQGDGGGGRISLYARSGNTAEPDTAWSPWRGGRAGVDGIRIESPAARYLQWKLVLAGGDPRISAVEAAVREQNLPPLVTSVIVAPQGLGFREGELSPHSEAITQMLPGGRKVEYSMRREAQPQALRELPGWARGLRTVQWNATDANGDPLLYRLETRREASDTWIELGDELEATTYTWDTSGLADGRYRVRVTATDEKGNAIGEERRHDASSEPFTIDNTPPEILAFDVRREGDGLRVSGRAKDEASVVARFEVSIDDGDWRIVTPSGGLADQKRLDFQVHLGSVAAGEHAVGMRVVDLAGNSTMRALRITVH